ncbi:MAG: hypothetical protein P4L91_06850 [Burkholderiaceae bacterium]|nr:hypothetical protein [Burkholderiaceae bacterium]
MIDPLVEVSNLAEYPWIANKSTVLKTLDVFGGIAQLQAGKK